MDVDTQTMEDAAAGRKRDLLNVKIFKILGFLLYNSDQEMTKLLEKAFVKASALPVADQDILAQSLLDDLARRRTLG